MTCGTITGAANFLHVSSYGQAFLPLASQWASVFRDSRSLKTLDGIRTLSIASVDAVNNYTLVPLFNRHIESCPNIRLQIRTHHSDEIHGLISNRTADIGFVFSRSPYPDIISRPVYRELMYLVCRKDSPYHDGIDPSELGRRMRPAFTGGCRSNVRRQGNSSPREPDLLHVQRPSGC